MDNKKQWSDGFTLVEFLVAVSIMVIMGGSAFTAFQTAVNVYQKSESKIVLNQKVRIALNQVTTDLVNLQAVEGDSDLLLISQDSDDPDEMQNDLISFVTLVKIDPDPYLQQLNANAEIEVDEDQTQTMLSDVQRVAYYIGPDPSDQISEEIEDRGSRFTDDSDQDQTTALLRITTTSLEPETVILPLIEDGSIPETDENGDAIQVEITPIIDNISSLDIKYFDGEEWYDFWESDQLPPVGVQVLISVAAPSQRANEDPREVTQSTMVYLLMSANFSEYQQTAMIGQ